MRLKKGTLTNLYNERPTWLKVADLELDKAVLAAYAACPEPVVGPPLEWSQDWADVWFDTGAGQPLTSLMPPGARIMPLTETLLAAAHDLVEEGFRLADAVHLAAARELKVDVMLTVDDKLLRRAARIGARLGCRVANPVTFVEEVSDADEW